jgi:hypothetical protein
MSRALSFTATSFFLTEIAVACVAPEGFDDIHTDDTRKNECFFLMSRTISFKFWDQYSRFRVIVGKIWAPLMIVKTKS